MMSRHVVLPVTVLMRSGVFMKKCIRANCVGTHRQVSNSYICLS